MNLIMTAQLFRKYQTVIENAWENRMELNPKSTEKDVREAVEAVIAGLDNGQLRVAERAVNLMK